jgi:hypothetical protein
MAKEHAGRWNRSGEGEKRVVLSRVDKTAFIRHRLPVPVVLLDAFVGG